MRRLLGLGGRFAWLGLCALGVMIVLGGVASAEEAGGDAATLAAMQRFDLGSEHSCLVVPDGSVNCWGSNNAGELGIGSTINMTAPVVSQTTGVVEVSASHDQTCVILTSDVITCWGEGPVVVGPYATIPDPTGISVGMNHACAVTSTGVVRCWGQNRFGQLGDGTAPDTYTPVAVPSTVDLPSAAQSVSAGNDYSCAVLENGEVYCWGRNSQGNLGIGQVTFIEPTPLQVPGITNATGVAASDGLSQHSCALLADGTVQCWGDNFFGSLGNLSNADSASPVAVSGLTSAVAIAVGDAHSCAVLSTGQVKCWGANHSGQVGNGSTSNFGVPNPATVSGVSTAIAVSAGRSFTCVLLQNDAVDCWGSNDFGQLGNGTLADSSSPVAVLPLGDLCAGFPVTVRLGAGDSPTNADDVIWGTPGPDVIVALEGDDRICGLGGSDTINAGAGDDWVDAGSGSDTVFGLDGADTIFGSDGDDTLLGFDGRDTMHGGPGADVLNGGAGNDALHGDEGDDEIYGQAGGDSAYGGDGADIIVGADGFDTLHGGPGIDVLNGGPDRDTLWGEGGADTLFGLAGDDWLEGGDGDDTVFGQLGNDQINGNHGDDVLFGNEGNDTIGDWGGQNTINGGPGNDNLTGSDGPDTIYGDGDLSQAGNDVIDGGAGGPDLLLGFAGDDTISSTNGVMDTVNAGPHVGGDVCTTEAIDTVYNCNP